MSTQQKLMGTEDYFYWKQEMQAVMIVQNCWAAIEPASGQTPSDKEEQKAYAMLILNIDRSLQAGIIHLKKARDIWRKLESDYEEQNSVRYSMLKRSLNDLKKESGETVAQLITRANKLVIELTAAGETPKACDVADSVLKAMPAEYVHLRQAIKVQHKTKDLTLDIITPQLLAAEQDFEHEVQATADRERAFVSRGRGQQPRFSSSATRSEPRRSFKCWNCGKAGHKAHECRSAPRGDNNNVRHSNGGSNGSNNGSSGYRRGGRHGDGGRDGSHSQHTGNNNSSNSGHRMSAFMARGHDDSEESVNIFILDSAASSHYVPHRQLFSEYRLLSKTESARACRRVWQRQRIQASGRRHS